MKRAAALVVLGVTLVARRAAALDPFEIQVYDGTADAPGDTGLELHVNRVLSGLTYGNGTELPPNHQTHFTLEPSVGVTESWEIGGYFQTALRSDGTFDYAGIKARSKFVTPPKWHPHLRLGLNVELSSIPKTYDRGQLGGELRPIVAWENERWLFVVNPIVDFAFLDGHPAVHPTFEPAAMAKVKIAGAVAVGFEFYADLGPVFDPLPLHAQQHYLYEAVDLLSIPHVELNVGVGEGLNQVSNGFVAKMIVGYTWEHDPSHDPALHPVRAVSTR